MTSFELEVAILIAIGGGLTLYWLLGGADFGGGVWDLFAVGPLRDRQRSLISEAIGPVWEANHVWLIFVLTGLLAAFPPAFASLAFALYVPFSIAIAGIVFRGAAFAFRSWGDRGSPWQRTWTRVFGVASIVTPLAFGAAAGAIASGRISVTGTTVEAPLWGTWTGPVSIVTALLALTSCAFLAASYLTVEANGRADHVMEEDFRRRALGSGVAAGIIAAAGLLVLRTDAPEVWHGMVSRAWPLAALSAAGGLVSLWSVFRRRYRLARAGAAVAVAAVVGGWGVAQWPYLIVPDVTASDAAAPASALRPIVVGFVIGTLLVAPSLFVLFHVFKKAEPAPDAPPGMDG
jgi:cytochrome bd ubiquinol oxidase subunit II